MEISVDHYPKSTSIKLTNILYYYFQIISLKSLKGNIEQCEQPFSFIWYKGYPGPIQVLSGPKKE